MFHVEEPNLGITLIGKPDNAESAAKAVLDIVQYCSEKRAFLGLRNQLDFINSDVSLKTKAAGF